MGKWALWGLLLYGLVTSAGIAGCGTADNRVDPGDLELRDLLGFSPQAASEWGEEQREAARRVIAGSLAASDEAERFGASLMVAPYRDVAARDMVVAQALARWDERLAREGVAAVPLVRVAVAPGVARATVRPTLRSGLGARAGDGDGSGDFAMALEGWSEAPLAGLAGRASPELRELARDAGHGAEPLVVVPSGRLPVLAAYVEPGGGSEVSGASAARLLVNPVLLAAREPGDGAEPGAIGGGAAGGTGEQSGEGSGKGTGTTNGGGGAGGTVRNPDGARGGGGAAVGPGGLDSHAIGGNPYSFYGSVAECAYAQRLRCERCLGDSSCEPITDTSDGEAECVRLGEDGGRGYFLQCINLSLAITSVNRCAADGVPSCARSPGAANSLSTLEANANFLEDESCQVGLDRCLAKIYGKPDGDYPTPGGGGSGSPPRDIDVDCGQSCDDDDNNGNCEASPTCEGPSCNNSFSCDSTCSSSNDQSSGCGSSDGDSDCGSCSDDSGGGQGGSSCSSDEGGSSSGDGCGGGGSGDSSCDSSCNKSDGSGGSCGSCDSSGDSGGGGSSGGDGCGSSGGGGCGGGSGGGGCGGGGDSNKCSVAMPAPRDRGRPPAALSFLLMGLWGLAPIPAVMLARRRVTRKAAIAPPPEPLGAREVPSGAGVASAANGAGNAGSEEGAR